MSRTIVMFVPGTPGPQGSKRHVGRGVMLEMSKKVKPWRQAVSTAAANLREEPFTGPVQADITIIIQRPASHYRTGRNAHLLKDSAPAYPSIPKSGDSDKYARACFDGMTGHLYVDDVQVVAFTIRKRYTNPEHPEPGAWIYLTDQISTEQDQAA